MKNKKLNQNLIQYVFLDGSETITNSKGKVVTIKGPGTGYIHLDFIIGRYVQGTTPKRGSKAFSRVAKVNEYLITSTKVSGFKQRISTSPIKEINKALYFSSCLLVKKHI